MRLESTLKREEHIDSLLLFGRRASSTDQIRSAVLMTYRSPLPTPLAGRTSDVGWGCMLRVAQMALANALVRDRLGHVTLEAHEQARVESTLQLFEDVDQPDVAPFSIYNIARAGVQYGVPLGSWFGPQVACNVLAKLNHDALQRELTQLTIRVATNATLHRRVDWFDDSSIFTSHSALVLIPNRLGLDSLNEIYVEQLKIIMSLPQSMGILGGKTNQARYFVAIDEDTVFYLDPHFCQPVYKISRGMKKGYETYHTSLAIQSMPISDLDPSMAFAFYCEQFEEYERLLDALQTRIVDVYDFPVLSVQEKQTDYSLASRADDNGLAAEMHEKDLDDFAFL